MPDTERLSLARGFLFADLRGYAALRPSATVTRPAHDLDSRLSRDRSLRRSLNSAAPRSRPRATASTWSWPRRAPRSVAASASLRPRRRGQARTGRPSASGSGSMRARRSRPTRGYVSSAVNIAARVCALAGPGELLVTDAVRALTRTSLGVDFQRHGRHRLKGIDEPVALYRVTAGDGAAVDRRSWKPFQACGRRAGCSPERSACGGRNRGQPPGCGARREEGAGRRRAEPRRFDQLRSKCCCLQRGTNGSTTVSWEIRRGLAGICRAVASGGPCTHLRSGGRGLCGSSGEPGGTRNHANGGRLLPAIPVRRPLGRCHGTGRPRSSGWSWGWSGEGCTSGSGTCYHTSSCGARIRLKNVNHSRTARSLVVCRATCDGRFCAHRRARPTWRLFWTYDDEQIIVSCHR